MLNLQGRLLYSILIGSVSSLSLVCSTAKAENYSNLSILNNIYIAAFGGIGHASDIHTTQSGTVFFAPAAGGTLEALATGHSGADAGFLGLLAGYKWCGWRFCIDGSVLNIVPAVEFEGYYLRSTFVDHLDNSNERIPEHTFLNTFPTYNGVYLANAVLNIQTFCKKNVYPYLGVGVGAANISIDGADSTQTRPTEFGVNHFNSKPHDSAWAFAAQLKAGINYNIDCHWSLFTEYRLLYVASTDYTMGATQYPTHAPTTNWRVKFDHLYYNMGAFGIKYSF